MPMRKITKAIYLNSAEIDEQVRKLQAAAEALEDGPARQAILKDIAQRRLYADAKRWTESPGLKPGV